MTEDKDLDSAYQNVFDNIKSELPENVYDYYKNNDEELRLQIIKTNEIINKIQKSDKTNNNINTLGLFVLEKNFLNYKRENNYKFCLFTRIHLDITKKLPTPEDQKTIDWVKHTINSPKFEKDDFP